MGVATPAIPASTVPVVNNTGQYVNCNIAGGTMTNVSVNGVTVGTGAGNYSLPPGASLTMTYTVVPTSMTWTSAQPTAYNPGYSTENYQAEGPGYNPITSMLYPSHATGGFTGLATGVSN
jgi:hypothetical protein